MCKVPALSWGEELRTVLQKVSYNFVWCFFCLSLYICSLAHREWKWVWEYLWFQEKTCWKKILLLFQRFHNNLLPNFLELFMRACVCLLGVCHQGIIEVRSWSLLIWHDLIYAVVFHVSRAGVVVLNFSEFIVGSSEGVCCSSNWLPLWLVFAEGNEPESSGTVWNQLVYLGCTIHATGGPPARQIVCQKFRS